MDIPVRRSWGDGQVCPSYKSPKLVTGCLREDSTARSTLWNAFGVQLLRGISPWASECNRFAVKNRKALRAWRRKVLNGVVPPRPSRPFWG